MKFLDTPNVCVKQRRAKLLIDLDELLHQTSGGSAFVTMSQWCEARGLLNKAAALRDLYRRSEDLAAFSGVLVFGVDEDSRAFQIDLRGLRALVAREIDEATKWLASRGSRRAIDLLVKASVRAFLSTNKGMEGLAVAVVIHESAVRTALSRRVATQDLDAEQSKEDMSEVDMTPQLRVAWTRGACRPRVEAMRDPESVRRATLAARSGSPFKVKVSAIAELLDCSARTAARFVQRSRGGRPSSAEKGQL